MASKKVRFSVSMPEAVWAALEAEVHRLRTDGKKVAYSEPKLSEFRRDYSLIEAAPSKSALLIQALLFRDEWRERIYTVLMKD